MARKRIQKQVQDRVIGKSGGTRSGKAFGKMVHNWDVQKFLLRAAGYIVAYDKGASEKVHTLLYRITFPNGHEELMTLEQAMALNSATIP